MWAIVLAGGQSRRMGRPKADLEFGEASLLERVVLRVRAAVDEVVLVGAPLAAARLNLRSAEDWLPGAGPLSGLAGGLAVAPGGLHALVACDLPFIEAEILTRLAALGAGFDAVVPEVDGRRHPLCALYDRRCLAEARACLDDGRRRMEDLLARVRVRAVAPPEVQPARLERAVINVNTPEDYRSALRTLAAEP
jgi:molybdopterin-guanine dinucleotide biosynthesis protein A